MSGYIRLFNLPIVIKDKIVNEYGSLMNLYQKIFVLNHEMYLSSRENNERVSEIENEILDIEEKLEEFGVDDGSDITVEVSSDHGDIIVSKRIDALNEYLADFGTDFEEMRSWLHEQYNI